MFTQRGFTLIELMVTIAVMAIVVRMAAPSFNQLVVKTQLNKNARELAGTLAAARSQAVTIRRNVTVNIAPSSAVTETEVVKVWSPLNSVTVKRSAGDSTPDQVVFLPTGSAQVKVGAASLVAASSSNTIKLCDSKAVKAKVLSFTVAGSTLQAEGTC